MKSFQYISLVAFSLVALTGFNSCAKPKVSKPLKTQNTQAITMPEASSQEAVPQHYSQINFPEFTYQTPNPLDYRIKLDDHTILYLYPSKQLPIIKLDFYFEESNETDQEDLFPAYSLLGSNYKRGGTQRFTPAQLEDTLEFQSTSISVSLSNRTSSISINSLKEHFPDALGLMKEITLNPKFDQSRLEVFKQQLLQVIKHKYDKASNISSDLFSTVMYGTHPNTWSLTESEVLDLTPQQLAKLSQQNFTGQKLYIGVSGDFEKDSIITQIQSLLKTWKTRKTEPTYLPAPKLRKEPGIHVIDFPSTQTQIRMAQEFVQRPHADFYPSTIASYILGSGGFSSRLVAKVRTEYGLAYGISSFTQSNYFQKGLSGVRLQTKVESTTQALQLIQQEIVRLTEEGPTDQEMQSAIEGLIASLPSVFDKPESTVDAFIYSERRGRTMTHYVDYPKALRQVTKAQVQEVLKKYFSPEKMIVTLVGPLEKMNNDSLQTGPALDSLGDYKLWTLKDLESRTPKP